jgi:ActR/RegA family two-component response regulator
MARILVIEDNPHPLETYAAVLRAAAYDVDLAATAKDGLARVRPEAHDLALVDLFLPDGTAIDLLTTLARRPVSLPVIVVTGEGSLETAVEAMRQGAIDYAVKPLIGDDLLAKVQWGLDYAATRAAPPIPPDAYGHAATRWAALVVALRSAPSDVRTISEWARLVGVSPTTLRDWCRLANASAARSLALGRVLRAVHVSHGRHGGPRSCSTPAIRARSPACLSEVGYRPAARRLSRCATCSRRSRSLPISTRCSRSETRSIA